LGAMLKAYPKLQPKPKTIPELINTLQRIWIATPFEFRRNL